MLYAICNEASIYNKQVNYIPLKLIDNLSVDILSGLEHFDLVCIDDVHVIAQNKLWQEAIFDLFNRLMESNHTKLIITSNNNPKKTAFTLPDLVSRLDWGEVYHLKELSDDDKLHALQVKAHLRGFDLPTEVGVYLLKRVNRDMNTLANILDELDRKTITEQRKLTIPFIKTSLNL